MVLPSDINSTQEVIINISTLHTITSDFSTLHNSGTGDRSSLPTRPTDMNLRSSNKFYTTKQYIDI